MYTAFYGLREKPFALSPDPRFLYLAESHREALAHLLYGIEQGEGFIAVTGEVGTGKTTLCRALLRRLGSDREVAFLFNPKLSAEELLQAVHHELGIRSHGTSLRELVDDLNQFLVARRRDGKRVLLIVDEAQGLSPATLEQIRLLSNLETDQEKLIQILLLGQPELDAMLSSPALRQLEQRIAVRWRLSPLTRRETQEYVRHRLRIAAGDERDLLTDAACREVHRFSRGIPRLVNLLCDRALLAGYAEGTRRIGPDLVRRADRELRGAARRSRPGARLAAAIAAMLGVALLAGAGVLLLRGAPPWLALRVSAAPELEQPAPGSESAVAPLTTSDATATSDAVEVALDPVGGGPGWEEADGEGNGAAAGVDETALPPSEAPAVSAPGAEPLPVLAALGPEAGSTTPHVGKPTEVVEDLTLALARRPPGETTAAALEAALGAWDLPPWPEQGDPLSFPRLLGELSTRGLSILTLPRTDLDMLRALDHPTLLLLAAADGVPRVVMLGALDVETASLFAGGAEGPLEVPISELARAWTGEAYVLWRDFETLPELLDYGSSGPAVTWLQGALGELGLYAHEPSGVFDAATYQAVRTFQEVRQLVPDGTVGPLTKIALYDALARYSVPRLTRLESVG